MRLRIAAAALMGAGLLAGCGSGGGTSSPPATRQPLPTLRSQPPLGVKAPAGRPSPIPRSRQPQPTRTLSPALIARLRAALGELTPRRLASLQRRLPKVEAALSACARAGRAGGRQVRRCLAARLGKI